ncbi:DUF305 domain-containing protein [Herbaspirillum sp. RV1423]|uniref:DUF305 domain-containing protein n=1 Tax=Herbaspirillum sp. RV1423 TaxID=1443993 RepID=UPI0005514273|nr:DUF305 domain-containing protein [Herbaspirillum sp. RV1423]
MQVTNKIVRGHRHVAGAAMIASAVVMAAIFLCSSGDALAQEMHHHHEATGNSMAMSASASAPVFIASTAKPFAGLMDDAMAVMDYGMAHAPMSGKAEHDFVTMMMPHHQGAVDMAKAVLLYSDDPEIRNLALGIITEQQTEIRVMQAWLRRHGDMDDTGNK